VQALVVTGAAEQVAVGWRLAGEGFSVATRGADGSWAAAEELALPADSYTPALLPGAPGEWWALWRPQLGPVVQTQSYGGTRPYAVRTARLSAAGAWDAPQTLAYEPGPSIFNSFGWSRVSNGAGHLGLMTRLEFQPWTLSVLR
jgi:hypothetical protein